jgi:polyphosphate kinase
MLSRKGEENDIFAAIRRGDVLLHHPFDSFQPIISLLKQAAVDPQVQAIKMTLYRVGRNSPVVEALLEAIEEGKQVAVLVELKARFDEESNIEWARALERQGVHVVYGLLGLKIHTKLAMVVRREGKTMRRYMHLGTGNYNAVTAHLYTDMGMFTCDKEIGEDVSDLFNYLTGYSEKKDYRKLLVAPIDLRQRLVALIEREIVHAQAGRPARLIFKANGLVDRQTIRLLYAASSAGVRVDLLVRGVCCLRPGMPGISDNIRVTSIVGRFLEHSRIFFFENGGEHELYMGSADLMPRNLNERVETIFPVTDSELIRFVREDVLELYLRDNVKARRMHADGSYSRVSAVPGEDVVNAQEILIERTRKGGAR